jgi:hypothetical protein
MVIKEEKTVVVAKGHPPRAVSILYVVVAKQTILGLDLLDQLSDIPFPPTLVCIHGIVQLKV